MKTLGGDPMSSKTLDIVVIFAVATLIVIWILWPDIRSWIVISHRKRNCMHGKHRTPWIEEVGSVNVVERCPDCGLQLTHKARSKNRFADIGKHNFKG